MDAVAESLALVEEYRKALRAWSAARALYAADSPEVLDLLQRLDNIESQLKGLRPGALVKYQPPPDTDA